MPQVGKVRAWVIASFILIVIFPVLGVPVSWYALREAKKMPDPQTLKDYAQISFVLNIIVFLVIAAFFLLALAFGRSNLG